MVTTCWQRYTECILLHMVLRRRVANGRRTFDTEKDSSSTSYWDGAWLACVAAAALWAPAGRNKYQGEWKDDMEKDSCSTSAVALSRTGIEMIVQPCLVRTRYDADCVKEMSWAQFSIAVPSFQCTFYARSRSKKSRSRLSVNVSKYVSVSLGAQGPMQFAEQTAPFSALPPIHKHTLITCSLKCLLPCFDHGRPQNVQWNGGTAVLNRVEDISFKQTAARCARTKHRCSFIPVHVLGKATVDVQQQSFSMSNSSILPFTLIFLPIGLHIIYYVLLISCLFYTCI